MGTADQIVPPPGFGPPPSAPKSKVPLVGLLAGLGVLAVVALGGIVYLLTSGDDGDNVATDDTVETTDDTEAGGDADAGDGTDDDTTGTDGDDDDGATDTTVADADADSTEGGRSLADVTTPGSGEHAGDVVDCTVLDEQTILLEVVNSSTTVQTYSFEVTFFTGGAASGEPTSAFVNNLRPGERTIEESFVFEDTGETCVVTAADAFDSSAELADIGDATSCRTGPADFAGDITGEVDVTNSGSTAATYSLQVAFIDPDGVRRGTGFGISDEVAAGAAATIEILSLVDEDPTFTCEVVGLSRLPA